MEEIKEVTERLFTIINYECQKFLEARPGKYDKNILQPGYFHTTAKNSSENTMVNFITYSLRSIISKLKIMDLISRDLLKQRHIKNKERFIALRRFGVIVTPLSRLVKAIVTPL